MHRFWSRGILCHPVWALPLALCVTGCHEYRPPPSEAPHALVRGIFAGGRNDAHRDLVSNRGYEPRVVVCNAKKKRDRCRQEVFPYVLGRSVSFRVPVGRPISITPYGLIGLDYKNSGNEIRMNTTKCYGESLTIVPRNRAQYQFTFAYDPSTQGCQAEWRTSFRDEY